MTAERADAAANDPYELEEPAIVGPPLPGSVTVGRGKDETIDAIAADLLVHAKNCVRTFGDFHLALSGGSTPLPLYERLMYDPVLRSFPWAQTHLWIVDERRVPFDSDLSNFRHIKETIVDHSGIPNEQVHPILATLPDAAELYENELREHLGWREKGQDRLDCAVLGMGDDGHTASLFPHSPALDETVRLAVVNDGPGVTPPPRVTMTYPLLNASRLLAILVCGAGKAPMLARVAGGADDFHALPIKGIRPLGGELRWYLDAAAAG